MRLRSILLILAALALLRKTQPRNFNNYQDKNIVKPHVHSSPEQTARETQWRNEQRRNWRRQLWPQWALAGIAICTLVAGIISVIVLVRTLRATRDQADAAIAQLHVSQRPWVGIIDPPLITDPLTFDAKGAGLRVIFTIKNSGGSTAIKVHTVATLEFTKAFTEVLHWQNKNCEMPDIAAPDFAHLILPGQEKPFPTQIRREQVFQELETTQLWLVGCVYYWDQFERKHRTPFIYAFATSDGKSTVNTRGTIHGKFVPFPSGSLAN